MTLKGVYFSAAESEIIESFDFYEQKQPLLRENVISILHIFDTSRKPKYKINKKH